MGGEDSHVAAKEEKLLIRVIEMDIRTWWSLGMGQEWWGGQGSS